MKPNSARAGKGNRGSGPRLDSFSRDCNLADKSVGKLLLRRSHRDRALFRQVDHIAIRRVLVDLDAVTLRGSGHRLLVSRARRQHPATDRFEPRRARGHARGRAWSRTWGHRRVRESQPIRQHSREQEQHGHSDVGEFCLHTLQSSPAHGEIKRQGNGTPSRIASPSSSSPPAQSSFCDREMTVAIITISFLSYGAPTRYAGARSEVPERNICPYKIRSTRISLIISL